MRWQNSTAFSAYAIALNSDAGLELEPLLIGRSFEEEVYFRSFEQQNKPLFNGVKKNLEKHFMGYQIGVRKSLLKHAAKKFGIQWSKWERTDKLHLGSKLIDLFVESVGLVRLLRKRAFKDTTTRTDRGIDEVDHGLQGPV